MEAFKCKGGKCDNPIRCEDAGGCTYKSSAQEAREAREAELKALASKGHKPDCNGGYSCEADCFRPTEPFWHDNPMDVVQCLEERKTAVEDFKGTIDGHGFKVVMDSPKLPLELIPPVFPMEISTVLLHGAKKYAPNNWMRGMSYTTVYGAIQRHLTAWFAGEDLDPESGLNHLAHAACGLAFLAHYRSKPDYEPFDDRVFK